MWYPQKGPEKIDKKKCRSNYRQTDIGKKRDTLW